MSLREEREREELERAKHQNPEPVILTLEQASEQITELANRRTSNALPVVAIICSIVIPVVIAFVAPNFQHQKAPSQMVTMEQYQQLKSQYDALQGEVQYLKAHTDSTGLADMRHELNEWRGNAEELSATSIRLTEAYDRAFLQGVAPKK